MPRIEDVSVQGDDGLNHRERMDELRERAGRLVDDAYRMDAPWELRDVAVPLVLDALQALGAAVLELELLRAARSA